MPRSFNQKLKPFYVMNYLLENTDEEHTVTVNQIIAHLEAQGISAERKSIYSDIEALQVLGVDIECVDSGNYVGYYVASRTFELPELKLLVDSVQSSKFITHIRRPHHSSRRSRSLPASMRRSCSIARFS